MEREGEEEKKKEGSYRYWVREATSDAAPPPLPQKLTNNDVVASNAPALGSLWNQAGTWEEKNLTKWATDRLKELLGSVGSLQFSSGKAEIFDVNRCVGDVSFLIFVFILSRLSWCQLGTRKELAILTSFPSKSKESGLLKRKRRRLRGVSTFLSSHLANLMILRWM
ncbi:uncharacterized protein LOC103856713 isoform X3 [Brassica rapa]|uniref:uncharacterized protein LOC103856713 isoform X3 n=1 Tax=Brassica campestris TaxID=3711 RepID=UPI00142D34D1|nr:uncharacterized protein LOC103856713 isoform X3 [Brassica rapa]